MVWKTYIVVLLLVPVAPGWAASDAAVSRGPAVLPEPGLAAFSGPRRSSFGLRGEPTFNRRQEGADNAHVYRQEDHEAFAEGLSNLASRYRPFTYQDYAEFRDFIATQSEALGELDFSASGFRKKAKEVFEAFQDRDVSVENADRKRAFNSFVQENETQVAPAAAPSRRPSNHKRPTH